MFKIKKYSYLLIILLSVILLIALFGCRKSADDSGEVPGDDLTSGDDFTSGGSIASGDSFILGNVLESDYIFIPEFIPLSAYAGNLPNLSNVTATENAVFISSTTDRGQDKFFQTTSIHVIELDGMKLSKLPNYSTSQAPPDAEGGVTLINTLQIEEDGSLWIAETGIFVKFDFPLYFDINKADESEIWAHHVPLDSTYKIRKLDVTGMELLSIDIGQIMPRSLDLFGLTAFIKDDDNIIIGSGQSIYILDLTGNVQFSLETESHILNKSIIRLSDARIAYFCSINKILSVIDTQNNTWGDSFILPQNVYSVFNGFGEFLFIFNDDENLIAVESKTFERLLMLNFISTGVIPYRLIDITPLPDDEILLTTTYWEFNTEGQHVPNAELIILKKIHIDELPEKTVLTIASFRPQWIQGAVTDFNRVSFLYQVEIINLDFSSYWESIDNLILDLMRGNGPDMIHTAEVPFHRWIKQGLYVDLYELIDADRSISRSDFVESVLLGTETDGRLYQMFPDFSVETVLGDPNVVGGNRGWDFNEFKAVVDANPQANRLFGTTNTNIWYFIYEYLKNSLEKFIDWEAGTTDFNNDEFIALIEFTYSLRKRFESAEIDWNWVENDPFKRISSGEQILLPIRFSEFENYSAYQDIFGGDFIFKGFPAESGSGNTISSIRGLAITAVSENKQGAWEFLRFILSESWQRKSSTDPWSFDIPVNKVVLDEVLANAMQRNRHNMISWMVADYHAVFRPLTQEHVNNIRYLIDSVSTNPVPIEETLWLLIADSIGDYLNNKISAQDAARIIQSRASIYVSEQSG